MIGIIEAVDATIATLLRFPELPTLQTLAGGGTVRDSSVMATINRDIERRVGRLNTWHGSERRALKEKVWA